ncbi:MAG: amidohydrolase family protein [Ilumatobacteraceae bacterium]
MSTMIIDTDTHVIEPPDLWTERISKSKWGDLVPHVIWNDKAQSDMWTIGDTPVMRAWAHAMAGWPEPFPHGPKTQSEVDPACYDAEERLKGMSSVGIDVAVLYPNLGLGMQLIPQQALELSFEIVRAYNDWLLDWVSVSPTRFVALACIPYWDVEESVREIERCAALGHRGIITTGAPHLHDQPTLAHRRWDPIWAATQAAGLPISFHVGSGAPADDFRNDHLEAEGPTATTARGSVWTFLENGKHVTELLFSGVLARFPELRFISVESGIGWVPFALEASDYQFDKGQVWKERPEFEMKPSEYFRRQVYVNYWFERLEDHHIDSIGLDHILFETDFPHPTCLVGDQVPTAIDKGLGHRSQEVRDRILWQNAAELFGLPAPAR